MKIQAKLISLNPFRQEEILRLKLPYFTSSFSARFIRNRSTAALSDSKNWIRILETVDRNKTLFINVPDLAARLSLDPERIRSWQKEGKFLIRLEEHAYADAVKALPRPYPKEKIKELIKSLKISPIQQADGISVLREPSGRVILSDGKTKRCWDLFEKGPLRDWRGKMNGQTVQILKDGRQFLHLKKDKTTKYISGAWKVCKFAEEAFTGTRVARLVLKLKDQPENLRRLHVRGTKILQEMQGPGIIEHYGDLETKNKRGEPIIVNYQRLCRLGDLFQYLYQSNPTKEQRDQIAKDLLQAVDAMHQKRIYHRDLKEENILLDYNDKDPSKIEAKLCDFDLGWFEGEKLNEYCGTRHAFAPERAAAWLNRTMNATTEKDLEKNDVWGLGLILYSLYNGSCKYPAGINRNEEKTIREKLAELSKQKGGSFLEPADPTQKIIWKMLQTDPNDRITIRQALQEFEKITTANSPEKPNRLWRWLGFTA